MLNIPHQRPGEYENTFLAQVFIQARFPRLLKLDQAAFHALIRDDFPFATPIQNITISTGQDVVTSPGLKAATADEGELFELMPERLTYVATKYPGYEIASAKFQDVLGRVADLFQIPFLTRVALRYVDVVEQIGAESPVVWEDFVRPELLNLTLSDEFVTGVMSSEHAMLLQHSGATIRMRWSVREGTNEGQAIQRLDLDLDMFADEQRSVDAAKQRLDEFHETLISIFEWCITDRWRQEMESQ